MAKIFPTAFISRLQPSRRIQATSHSRVPCRLSNRALSGPFLHSVAHAMPAMVREGLLTLPPDIISQIARYFRDDYIFYKYHHHLLITYVSDCCDSLSHVGSTPYHMLPCAPLAITSSCYLWIIVPWRLEVKNLSPISCRRREGLASERALETLGWTQVHYSCKEGSKISRDSRCEAAWRMKRRFRPLEIEGHVPWGSNYWIALLRKVKR